MNSMKYLAGPLVALATLVGSQTASAATTLLDSLNITYFRNYIFQTSVPTADTFWSALESLVQTNSYSAVATAFQSLLANGETIDGTNTVASTVIKGVQSWSGNLDFNSLTSTITFTAATFSAGSATVTTYATPGPIAAAGLPAVLGLMGFAAWKRRRNAVAA